MPKEIKTVYELLRSNINALGQEMVLPVAEKPFEEPRPIPTSNHAQIIEEGEFISKIKAPEEVLIQAPVSAHRGFFQRDYVKYPMIFIISFGFFYFFLNFGAFSTKLSSYFTKDKTPVAEITTKGKVLGAATPEFNSWIGKYFYFVNEQDALSPNLDYDRDGLTNYQEFLLHTNPVKKDTDNDDFTDGQEILNGYNPLTEGKLSSAQQQIISEWDLREINTRISFASATSHPSNNNPTFEPDTSLVSSFRSPSGIAVSDYDLNSPGEVYIPKINARAPLIFTKAEKDMIADLENGLINYPGAVLPGQTGVSYISGHSSNYIWSKSKYSYVFTRLNELETGDEFFVTINKTNGDHLSLRYVVFGKQEYKPDDQGQFESQLKSDESQVNLSTCWPLGSTARRYVVSGKLTGV